MTRILLLFCLIYPMFLHLTVSGDQNDCSYDEIAANNEGRSCENRQCNVDADDCKGKRTCMCDGACGFRCISAESSTFCPRLDPPVNGSIVYLNGDQSFSSKASYKCIPGYLPSKSVERKCLGDREWSNEVPPVCLPQDQVCPVNANASVNCPPSCTSRKDCPQRLRQGCICHPDCGMSCLAVYVSGYCPQLDLPSGTRLLSMKPRGRIFSSVATLSCEDHFDVENGSAVITCQLDKNWSATPLRCKPQPTCERPPSIDRLEHNARGKVLYPGDTITYDCRDGYNYYGSGVTSTCQKNLTWTRPMDIKCYPTSCGDPGYLQNGWREGDIFTFQSSVTFHCNEGYEMRGFPYRTCLSTQDWSSFMPECVAIECPRAYPPDHGTMQGSQFMYDDEVHFRCDSGYKLKGSDMRRCQSDKTWSGVEPTCRLISCPTPEAPEHGSMIAPRVGLNAIIRFSCNSGYTMVGSRLSRCTAEETWSEPAPVCQAGCTVPDSPQNGYYDSRVRVRAGDSVQHGHQIQIICYSNYVLNSNLPYMCDNGRWSFDAECIPRPCSKGDELPNANVTYTPLLATDSSTVPHGTTFAYICIYGFQPETDTSTSIWTCNFGHWSGGDIPKCQPKSCPEDDFPNGKVVYYKDAEKFRDADGPHHGVTRAFNCGRGFSLVGALSGLASICDDGQWSTRLPSCEPDSCDALEIPDDTVEYSNTDLGHGTTAWVTCRSGLKLSVGNGKVECHAGHWVPDGVTCVNSDASTNVAFGKRAWQSTSSKQQAFKEASRAVDGDRTTDKIHGSCFAPRRTNMNIARFWEVDLEATYMIEHVDIYMVAGNRNNAGSQQVTVQIGPSGASAEYFTECGRAPIATQDGQPIRMHCTSENLYGQVIRIPLNWSNRMTLCEVEVFSTGPLQTCPIPDIDGQDDELRVNMLIASGETIKYRCKKGYKIYGALWNRCDRGLWENENPECRPVACDVNDPYNGRLNYRVSQITHETELDYTCDEYYEKKVPRVVCKFGVLKPAEPSCVPESCRLDASALSNVLINGEAPSLDSDGMIVILHGTQLQFSCKRGFYMANGNTRNYCHYGDLQSPYDLPSCIVIQCGYPTYLTNGHYEIHEGTFLQVHGTVIRYYCYDNYVLEDPNTEFSTCDNGQWTQDRLPRCIWQPEPEAECPTPSVQQGNIFYNGQNIALMRNSEITFSHNDQILIQCVPSYVIKGSTTLSTTCQNGLWNPALVPCEPIWYSTCPQPENIDNIAQYIDGKIKLDDAGSHVDFQHSMYLESRCRDVLKYQLTTEPIRTCLRGQWVGPTPNCEETSAWFVQLNRQPVIQQYFANGTLLIYPGVGELRIECRVASGNPEFRYNHRESFSRNGNVYNFGTPRRSHSGMYVCKKLGWWSSTSHTLHILVAAVSCPEDEVQPPLNGRRNGDDLRIGGVVSFECDEGYDLVGDRTFKCFLGKWLGKAPVCQGHDCPEIQPNDPNLVLITRGNSSGSRVAFTCKAGYTLVGQDIIDCEGGRWSHSIPHCEVVAAVSTDVEPIQNCSCEVWKACVMDIETRKTVCKCIHPQDCPVPDSPDELPYCGSDGQTYPSICKMKALACFLNKNIEVVRQGDCPEDMTPEVEDGDSSSVLSMEYYSDFPSESTQGMTTPLVSPTGNQTVSRCDRCTSTDLQRACHNFSYIFVGQPTSRLPGKTHLTYSIIVILAKKGLSRDMEGRNITVFYPMFDEVNGCVCPELMITREHLFILESSLHDNFMVTSSSVVELWAEKSLEFHEYCSHVHEEARELDGGPV